MRKLRALVLIALLLFGLAESSHAYAFEWLWWPNGNVWFWLQLTPTQYRLGRTLPKFPMWDGSASFEASFRDAMFDWSYFIQKIQLQSVIFNSTYGSDGDGNNHVWFNSESGGDSFNGETLAVTQYYYYTKYPVFAEADITFNSNVWWESFRGPLKPYAVYDFHRVALHELGHAIGLDHPDDHGQNVSAIMNSHISDLDFLSADDIAGAQQLYGARQH